MATGTSVAASDTARLLGAWHRSGPGYLALAAALRSLILDGRLPLRTRLPSERDLAAALGVSRTTTTGAYDVLRAEGFVESRRGSGSRVALPTGGSVEREVAAHAAADDREGEGEGVIDMTIAALPAPGAMVDAVAAATRDLSGHLGSSGYVPLGLRSLRRAVADHFAARGLPTSEDEIVVTSGAQHALALLLDVLTAPGDAVLVESPTYPNAFAAIRRAGVRPVAAPMRDDGWDVETVATRFREAVPRLAYLIPDFQNPTGFAMADAQRAAVVAAAERAGAHVVVDETFVQLRLDASGPPPGPMAAYDRDGRVVTVGSMSKAYWGGLRVGWIRCAPALARRVAAARAAVDLATPLLEQLVSEHLLRTSEAVLAERRALLRERRDALVGAVRRDLPAWRFRVPGGGLSLWVELDRPEAEPLAAAAETEGVRFVPGHIFGPDGSLDRWIRLPYTHPPELLEEAVRRLAAAERRLRLGARPAPARDLIA